MSNPGKRTMEMAENALRGWCQNAHDSLTTIMARACERAALEERLACACIVEAYINKPFDAVPKWGAEDIWEEIMARNSTSGK